MINNDIHVVIKEKGSIRIQLISSRSFRVQFDKNGIFGESALNRYGILETAANPVQYKLNESEQYTTIKTDDAAIIIDRRTGKLTLQEGQGKVLLASALPPWSSEGTGFGSVFQLSEGERIYGMGDVTRECLQKRGLLQKMYVANVASYVPIPFLMSSRGWGLLINTTWKHYVDIGNKEKDILRFWGEKGSLDYYLFAGDSYAQLLDSYTDIAGKPVMLPIWAYGLTFVCNQQADAKEMIEDCLNMRREGIPCDVVGLEPGWMEKYYDTTVEKNWHPDKFYIPWWAPKGPQTFLGTTNRMGFKSSLWLCCDYDVSFEEERQIGVQKADGFKEVTGYHPDDFEQDIHIGHEPLYMDKITKREEPWFDHLKKFIDQGVSAFKLDAAYQVNEHPDRLWGNGMTDEEMHNLYPLLYNKQMSMGFREHTGKRAMIYSAGGYTGIQKYSATWAGDTGGGPKPLVSMLNHGMSGHSNVSCDMDVFTPAGIHFGFLQTWSQVNSWAYWRHPWLLGDKLSPIFKYYAKLRYRLLPYIYSMAHIAAATAMPVMRAMPLIYPKDAVSDQLLDHYMLGESLLVTVFTDTIHLPQGEWTDYWTGEKYIGPCDLKYEIPEDKGGGLFVKAGAMIPYWPEMDYVGQKSLSEMEIHIYDGRCGNFTLYEDDGETYQYCEGKVSKTRFKFTAVHGEYQMNITQEGDYTGMLQCRNFTFVLHAEAKAEKVFVNGEKVDVAHHVQHQQVFQYRFENQKAL